MRQRHVLCLSKANNSTEQESHPMPVETELNVFSFVDYKCIRPEALRATSSALRSL